MKRYRTKTAIWRNANLVPEGETVWMSAAEAKYMRHALVEDPVTPAPTPAAPEPIEEVAIEEVAAVEEPGFLGVSVDESSSDKRSRRRKGADSDGA